MKRIALFLLAGIPLMMGQMCGLTESQPSEHSTPQGGSNTPGDTPTARTIVGPGFSLTIPAGFARDSDFQDLRQSNFMEAYGDGERMIVISTETPEPNGPYNFDSASVRIDTAMTTDSGDFLLRTIICPAIANGESVAGYALLAGGDLLCVKACSGRPLLADDETFGIALLRSIVLDNTDGRLLQQKLFANNPKLLGQTDQGLMVLENMTIWLLDDATGSPAYQEMRSWTPGVAIQSQGFGESMELLQVGRWVAVPVQNLGLATETRITAYDETSRRITFADGQSRVLLHSKLPQAWQVGMTVLLVQHPSGEWIIRPQMWQSIRI